MNEDYRQATLYVCDFVEERISDEELQLPRVTFRSALLLETFGVRFIHDNDARRLFVGIDHAAAEIEAAAWSSPEVFDLCSELCRNLWDAGLPLAPAFQSFVSKVLAGAERPRRKRGGAEKRNWFERHLLYWLALKVADRYGLALTRNDSSFPVSAADAVAEGLSVCGRPTTFTEIKNLCVHPDYAQFREDFWTFEEAVHSRVNKDAIVEVLLGGPKGTNVTPSAEP